MFQHLSHIKITQGICQWHISSFGTSFSQWALLNLWALPVLLKGLKLLMYWREFFWVRLEFLAASFSFLVLYDSVPWCRRCRTSVLAVNGYQLMMSLSQSSESSYVGIESSKHWSMLSDNWSCLASSLSGTLSSSLSLSSVVLWTMSGSENEKPATLKYFWIVVSFVLFKALVTHLSLRTVQRRIVSHLSWWVKRKSSTCGSMLWKL